MICASGPMEVFFLYSKSPRARARARFPVTTLRSKKTGTGLSTNHLRDRTRYIHQQRRFDFSPLESNIDQYQIRVCGLRHVLSF